MSIVLSGAPAIELDWTVRLEYEQLCLRACCKDNLTARYRNTGEFHDFWGFGKWVRAGWVFFSLYTNSLLHDIRNPMQMEVDRFYF